MRIAGGLYTVGPLVCFTRLSSVWLCKSTDNANRFIAKVINASTQSRLGVALHETLVLNHLAGYCVLVDKQKPLPEPAVHNSTGSNAQVSARRSPDPLTALPWCTHLLGSYPHDSHGRHYLVLVMDRLGASARELLDRLAQRSNSSSGGQHGVPRPALKTFCRDLLCGLDWLHREKGVLHGDIKPGNVVLAQPCGGGVPAQWSTLQRPSTRTSPLPLATIQTQTATAAATAAAAAATSQSLSLARTSSAPAEPAAVAAAVAAAAAQATVRWKLVDFGSARFLSVSGLGPACQCRQAANELAAHTELAVYDTPSYAAPELLLDQSARTAGVPHPGCDLWSAGCVMWEAATGARLFPGLQVTQQHSDEERHVWMMAALLGRPPVKLLQRWLPVSRELYNITTGALLAERHMPLTVCGPAQRLVEEHNWDEGEAQLFAGFLTPLLSYDPHDRPTAAQALTHPWLADSMHPTC